MAVICEARRLRASPRPPRRGLTPLDRAPQPLPEEYRDRIAPAAIVERVTFNAHIIETGTDSFRFRRPRRSTVIPDLPRFKNAPDSYFQSGISASH